MEDDHKNASGHIEDSNSRQSRGDENYKPLLIIVGPHEANKDTLVKHLTT